MLKWEQPDTSTSIAIALIFISLLFIAGLSYKIVLTVLGICIPTGLIGITVILRMAQSSGDYRFGRIMAWLYPQDPRWSDIAAQQQNSIMAIGSGQLWGKGLNNSAATSMKNANYIIEPQTDFIFAVAGEELGFIRYHGSWPFDGCLLPPRYSLPVGTKVGIKVISFSIQTDAVGRNGFTD